MSSLLSVFDAVCLETSQLHERSELVTLLTARQALGRVPAGDDTLLCAPDRLVDMYAHDGLPNGTF
ncbi:hypothetical protein ADJ70_09180 [Olsenella sp. oral taxon 807]|nr:hypothetical protein ADJ70_09180 [Olsenella sp. oral taxon 807]